MRVRRICGYLMDLDALSMINKDEEDDQDINNDDDDNEEDDTEADGENEEINEDDDGRDAGSNQNKTNKNKFSMTFRDVEDSIRSFNGDDKYSVVRWIADFEETAELFEWSDIQKVIFTKKSLRGLAKLFIQGEKGLNTWKKLKKALKDEFCDRLNSAELHRQLEKRKMKKDESVQTY